MYKKTYDNFTDLILRLSSFEPFYQDSLGNQLIDYLVLDSLLVNKEAYKDIVEIKKYIKKIYKMEFEVAELKYSVKRLKIKKMVYCQETIDDIESTLIARISEDLAEKIEQNIDEIEKLEKRVFDRWKNKIINLFNQTVVAEKVKESIDLMERNLKIFITRIFTKHAIECVAILYPRSKKIHEWLELIKNPIFNTLPSINDIADGILENVGIREFFIDNHKETRDYINNLFNSSFYWHLIHVGNRSLKIFSKKMINNQKLFLDTNVLFSLTGLHGEYMKKSADSIIKFSKTLSYKLYVTTNTLKEFKYSITDPRNIRKFRKMVGLRKWNSISYNWVKNLDRTLNEYKIIKSDLFKKIIEESEDYLREQRNIKSLCIEGIRDNIIKHDAFHKILINKIRGKNKDTLNFSEAKAWLLTEDTKLVLYASFSKKVRTYLPYCLLVDRWIQINRPLIPRLKDNKKIDSFYQAIITTPSIRAYFSYKKDIHKIQEIEDFYSKCKRLDLDECINVISKKYILVNITQKETNPKEMKEVEKEQIVNLRKESKQNRIDFIKELLIDFINLFREKGKSLSGRFYYLYRKIFIYLILVVPLSWLSWNYLTYILINNSYLSISQEARFSIGMCLQLLIVLNLLNIPLPKHWIIWVPLNIPIIIAIILLYNSSH